MPDEYALFTKLTGLVNVPYHGTCPYRELAQLIAGSKLFIGNQSFPFALAEAMKCPRVLEVCPICPNCIPQSDNGYVRLTEGLLRHYLLGEPYEREFAMSYCMSTIGVKIRGGIKELIPGITYILVNAAPEVLTDFSEKARRDKAIILTGTGDYRTLANTLANTAKSRTICVVNTTMLKDYITARKVAELLDNHDGIAGMYVKQSFAVSESCFAVSRKAYEECGLFGLKPGSVADVVQRYAGSRYPFRSAGTTNL
jgi:hypothetical protein